MTALSILTWVLIAAFAALALYAGAMVVKALRASRRPRKGYQVTNHPESARPVAVETLPGDSIVLLQPGQSAFISPEEVTPPADPVSTAAAAVLAQELFGDLEPVTPVALTPEHLDEPSTPTEPEADPFAGYDGGSSDD